MASQDKEKKKGGLREALFGGTGSNGSAYRIIYLAITMVMTDKGPEQYAILLYGDDQGVVYSNTLPAHTIMYNYNDDVDGPYIKITKSFMPGSSKAEILLPKGYSFMAPSMPTVFANMPTPTVVTQAASEQNGATNDDERSGGMSTDEIIRMMNEQEEKAKAARAAAEANGENIDKKDEQVNDGETQALETKPQPKKPKKPVDTSNVIPESDPFAATFDSEALTEKINKFMEKRDSKTAVEAKPIKETDPRTIDEVKRESVDDEMERLMRNADQMRRIGEAADEDAAGGKDDKK